MNHFPFLLRYYKCYKNIRFKIPPNNILKWLTTLIIFFQYFFFMLEIRNPTKYEFDTAPNRILVIQCCFTFFPGGVMYYNYVIDSSFFLLVYIISFIFLEICVHYNSKSSNKCPIFYLHAINSFEQFFSPIMQFPLFFRLSLLIEILDSKDILQFFIEKDVFISLILISLCIILSSIHTFLSSLFLDPFMFIPHSKYLDRYDGKSNFGLFLFKFVLTVATFIVFPKDDELFHIVYIVLCILLIFLIFSVRVISTVHYSLFGAYFELAPLVSTPFLLIFEIYATDVWYASLFFIVLIHLLFVVILNIERSFVTRETKHVFDSLIHVNNENSMTRSSARTRNGPAEIHSFVSGLRIIGQLHGDPNIFIKFAANQHSSGQKVRASAMIEVVRFLGVFPSKREEMLVELEHLQSRSNYNRFTIYFFKKILKSLINGCSEKKKYQLEQIQRSFFIHHHLYWCARAKHQAFKAFVESFSTSFFYSSYKFELKALLNRYPYDLGLLKIYNNFLLFGCGDYHNYSVFSLYFYNLERKIIPIVDPLLHKIVQINPRIMSFLNKEERNATQTLLFHIPFQKRIYATTTHTVTELSTTETNYTNNSQKMNSFRRSHRNSSVSRNNTNSSIIPRDQSARPTNEEKYHISAFVDPSNRCIPFFFLLHLVVLTYVISFFIFYIIRLKIDTIHSLNEIVSHKKNLLQTYEAMSTSLYIPLSLIFDSENTPETSNHNNLTNETFYSKINLNENSKVNINEILVHEKIKLVNNEYQLNWIRNHHIFKSHNKRTLFENPMPKLAKLSLDDSSKNNKIILDSFLDLNVSNMTISECQIYYDSIYYDILDFLELIPEVTHHQYFILRFNSFISKGMINDNSDSCQMIERLFSVFYNIHGDIWELFNHELNQTLEQVLYFKDNQPMSGYIKCYSLSVFLCVLALILLYYIITMIHINIVFKGETRAISYLSSSERLVKLLFDEFEESWEALLLFIPELSRILRIGENPKESFTEKPPNGDFLTNDSQKSDNYYPTSFKSSILNEISNSGSFRSSLLHEQTSQNDSNDLSISTQGVEEEESVSEMISNAVTTTDKETKFKWLNTLVVLLLPTIILFVVLALFSLPVTRSIQNYKSLADITSIKGRKFKITINLIAHAFNQLSGYEVTSQQYQDVHNALNNETERDIMVLYNREQCLSLLGVTCTSISNLVEELIRKESDETRILFLSLPAFLSFGHMILRDMLYMELDSNRNASSKCEIAYFSAIVILIIYLFVSYYFRQGRFLYEGFNSLFHYPSTFLMENMNRNNQEAFHLPTAVISISSLMSTGEIYSMSENPIFNKTAISFIGEKMNTTFPEVSTGSNCEIREFSLQDHTSKKMFRSSTKIKKGGIMNTLMIEDVNLHAKKTYKDETITQKLMNFIPIYYAKLFGEQHINSYKYTNAFLIYVRLDSSLPLQIMEQYFSVLNATMMNFTAIKQISVFGSVFIFSTIKEVNPIVPFLFTRDLLIDSISPKRGKPTNGTFAVYVDHIPVLEVEINYDDEPFIDTNIEQLNEKINMLFLCPRNSVFINANIENIIAGITKNGIPSIDHNIGIDFHSVSFSFDQYLSHLTPFL